MALGIHPEPSHPATSKRRGHRLQFLVLYLILVFPVLLALRWPSDHPAVLIGIMAVLAYVLFCWTSYFHEAAHQTLLGRSKGWSIAWGRIVGTVVGVPYTAYRETHIRHHAYLNAPADWELWPYSDPKRSRTFRRVFVWIDLIFGQVTHALIYGRIYFHRNSPLSPAAGRQGSDCQSGSVPSVSRFGGEPSRGQTQTSPPSEAMSAVPSGDHRTGPGGADEGPQEMFRGVPPLPGTTSCRTEKDESLP